MTSGESKMKYVQGDLITELQSGQMDVIAHQANCFCKGRRGIAPLIFKAFPEAKAADDATVIGDSKKMGTFSAANTSNGGRVYNLYGQYHFDNKRSDYGTDYDALWSALVKMEVEIREIFSDRNEIDIGFPLIGCGLAGGDWKIVSSMIASIFDLPQYNIYIYTLEKLEGKEYVN